MKLITLLLSLCLGAHSQCGSQTYPVIHATAPCWTLCTPASFKPGAGCDMMIIEAEGADSYTWTGNGGEANSKTIVFVPTNQTGLVTYTLSGAITYTNGLTCTSSVLVEIMVASCELSTGLPEHSNKRVFIKYYDMLGQETKPEPGKFLIEQRGDDRVKTIILP